MPSIPAVVVGAESNGLGVIRALGRAGVPVIALSSDPKQPTARSRYCTAVKCADERSPRIIESLLDFGRRQSARLPLFLTMERTVALVAARRAELEPYFLINLPSLDTLNRINDKLELVQTAQALGIPVPEAMPLQGLDDLKQAAERLTFPIIVKPAIKTGGFESHFGRRALILDQADDLRNRFDDYPWDEERLIAQRFIAAPDSEIYFCLVAYGCEGQCLARFTGRKIRIWPPAIGNTASAEPVTTIPEIVEATDRLLGHVGFTGIGSVEFKRDPATGQYWLIEPTLGRTDYQSAIAPANGVNIPYVAYCNVLGRPVPTIELSGQGVKWFDPISDRRSAKHAMSAGTLDQARYRDSLQGSRVEMIRASDDPKPWIYTQRQRVVTRIKGTLKRALDYAPWAYAAPFKRLIPPEERWPAQEIVSHLKRHQLPSPSYLTYFKRDPERRPPNQPNIVVSPADGVIRDIIERDGRIIIDISMNFYDIHVQRVPIGGTVLSVEEAGHSVAKGSAEERRYFNDPWAYESDYLFPVQKVTRLETVIGEVVIRQISSIWARRIETFLKPGDQVVIGQRLGHIFLGSTVVLELPASVRLLVSPQIKGRPRIRADQPIRGGETLLANFSAP